MSDVNDQMPVDLERDVTALDKETHKRITEFWANAAISFATVLSCLELIQSDPVKFGDLNTSVRAMRIGLTPQALAVLEHRLVKDAVAEAAGDVDKEMDELDQAFMALVNDVGMAEAVEVLQRTISSVREQ